MQLTSLFSSAIHVLPLLISTSSALSNTSPLVVIAEKESFKVPEDHSSARVGSMQSAFENVVSTAARSCQYSAYIFVKHPEVSEKDINEAKMPFLKHAIDKAASRYLMAAAVGGETDLVDTYVSGLEKNIEKQCGALAVIADPADDVPLQPYSDTEPRVISVDIKEGTSTTDADEIIRKVVGHLPDGNFLLSYRTTPRSVDPDTAGEPTAVASDTAYQSLFQNYQFFNSAIFMGLLAAGLVITVFMIGLQAVLSLQISTAAFEPKQEPPRKKQ